MELRPGGSRARLTSPAMTRTRRCSPIEAFGAGHDERAAAHAQSEEAIAAVVLFDDAVERDRGVARDRQRQGRIALQFTERSRADHSALVHQHDLVGEAFDLGDRVGDVDDRQRQPIAQPLEERQDLVLGRAVERRQRLVHQEQLGLRQQRPADRDPLALAAGKLARSAVEQRRDAEQLDHFVEGDFSLRPPRPRRAARRT